jgi:predicted phosphodiesterase
VKILLAGDTHGDLPHVAYLIRCAAQEGCDRIVQVGDFGYWPHVEPFHEQVAGAARSAAITVYWLDGNHENFDVLETAVDMEAPDPQPMLDNLWYLPRASTWEWEGCRFMALGGAPSVDKAYRVEGESWWPQELLTEPQVERARSRGTADVLLTHDAPEGVCPIVTPLYKGDPLSQHHRQILSAVTESVQPKVLVHGHYHHRYTGAFGQTRVEGLGRNSQEELSWMVLDTGDWRS